MSTITNRLFQIDIHDRLALKRATPYIDRLNRITDDTKCLDSAVFMAAFVNIEG